MLKKIGIFGGTFDPIHIGHIRVAIELKHLLRLDRVHFVPCHYPTHRPHPSVTTEQRMAMVESAIEHETKFVADDRELLNESASYSIETVTSFRQEFGSDTALYFFMGLDSLLQFPSWHRWQDFLALCHIVVAARPGWAVPEKNSVMGQYYQAHKTDNLTALTTTIQGKIAIMPTTPLDIAASDIRRDIQAGLKPEKILSDSVWSYIKSNRLYGYTEKVANVTHLVDS